MPYDDLPNNGWGEPPKYDWLTIAAWATILLLSVGFWIGVGVIAWRWVSC